MCVRVYVLTSTVASLPTISDISGHDHLHGDFTRPSDATNALFDECACDAFSLSLVYTSTRCFRFACAIHFERR